MDTTGTTGTNRPSGSNGPDGPTGPTASGRLNSAGAVVFSRRLPLPRAEAWAAVTDPARTARWIGPWSGDPASGSVELTMTAEDGAPTTTTEVLQCEAEELLVVTTGPGGWVLTVRIADGGGERGGEDDDDDDDDDDDETIISLEQEIPDAESAASIGPGWDYYLDRLVAAETGRDPGTISFSPDYYPGLAEHYRKLLGG